MMPKREPLDWRVPKDVWDRFEEYVRTEIGDLNSYASRETERAIEEYVDEKRQAVENMVDNYLDLAGQDQDDDSNSKKDAYSATERVLIRVDPRLKNGIRRVNSGNYSYGETVARALEEYMAGGFVSRLKEKLERVDPDIRANLSMENNVDSDMTIVEKRRAKICRRLHTEFTNEELESAIADTVGDTDYLLNIYRDRVTDHRDVEPHPEKPNLWIPREKAEEIAPDGAPRVCRVPAEYLSKDEKLRRIKIETGRQAVNGRFQSVGLSASDIHEEILDMDGSERAVRNYMGEIADEQGFKRRKKSGTTHLCVDFKKVDADLSETILAYLDASDATDADVDEQTTAETNRDVKATGKLDAFGEPCENWSDDAVDALDDLPDEALEGSVETIARGKIARAKYPDEIDETNGGVSEAAISTVTDDEIQRVLDAVTDDEDDSAANVQDTYDNFAQHRI